MSGVNAARPAPAPAEREPRKTDRAGQHDHNRDSTLPHTVATVAAHHDRAWWRLEARRVGSDWSGVLALQAEMVARWRARHDPDEGAYP